MPALTGARNTQTMAGHSSIDVWAIKVLTNVVIHPGAMVCLNGGYAAPFTTATGLRSAGRAEEACDNTGGASGAKTVQVRRGVFKFANSSGGDLIGDANVGSDCYAVDDQTVALTSATSTRSVAGKIMQVDSDGVWVQLGF